jgi:hypothetical protein
MILYNVILCYLYLHDEREVTTNNQVCISLNINLALRLLALSCDLDP